MNNHSVGKLVMLAVPEGALRSQRVPNGAVGEIVDAGIAMCDVGIGEVAVFFERNKSNTITGYWSIPTPWLKPLGDDGLLSDEDKLDNPCKKFADKPVEEVV